MSVEDLQTLSLAFLIAAGVLFVVAVVMFFVFNVPKLISEVTGMAEKKGIAAIQKRSEQGETGSIKERTSVSEQLSETPVNTSSNPVSTGTVKLATRKLTASQDTTVLNMSSVDSQAVSQSNQENKLPILNPDTAFAVLEEFSFTSSTEVIE